MEELLQAIAQGFFVGSTYGLLALGMGLVYGVSGIVNFSHGDFVTLGMYLCLALFSALALDPYISVVIVLPVMTLVGAAVYQYLIRPIAGRQLLMIIQLTLGISLVLQNVLMMAFGGQPTRTPSMIESKLFIIGDIVVRGSHLVACIVSFALAILLYIIIYLTSQWLIKAWGRAQRRAAGF